MDILVTAGEEAKGKTSEKRTTVFKKNREVTLDLKTKASRQFLNDIHKNHGDFAFSLAEWDDEINAKLGLSECLKIGHLQPFELLEDKDGANVVRFMWTVGVLGNRNVLLASHQENDFELKPVNSEDETIKKYLQQPFEEVLQKKKEVTETK